MADPISIPITAFHQQQFANLNTQEKAIQVQRELIAQTILGGLFDPGHPAFSSHVDITNDALLVHLPAPQIVKDDQPADALAVAEG